jgi:hypothetical protein
MNDTAFVPARLRPILWGRIISLLGALGLCVSFFLPHMAYCISYSSGRIVSVDFAPIDILISHYGQDVFILPFFAAALLVPLLAFRAVPRVDAAKSVGKFLAWTDCAICLSSLVVGLAWFIHSFCLPIYGAWMDAGDLGYGLLDVGFVVLGLAIVALMRSHLPRKAAAAQFALWAYFLTFFTYDEKAFLYTGYWLSLAACGLLVLGSAIDWFQCRPRDGMRPTPQ